MKSLLAMSDADSRGSAALAGWARSAACREGYTSVFEVVDTAGNGISRFAIGTQTGLASQVGETLPLDSVGGLRVKSIGDGVSAVRIYGGSLPLKDSAGTHWRVRPGSYCRRRTTALSGRCAAGAARIRPRTA